MKLVIVSGLSGAGKSVALRQYEDLGWYCIDNLPLDLVQPLIAHAMEGSKPRYQRMAIGVDARGHRDEIVAFPKYLETLRASGLDVDVLFLTADEPTLLKRYNETRRKHPLSDAEHSLLEAVLSERSLLTPISNVADVTLDTSKLNLHELREALHANLPEQGSGLAVQFLSFGYKNGLPVGADYVFDVRCLPNPHWVPELRALNGRDAPVQEWFAPLPEMQEMQRDLQQFLSAWLPRLKQQDRAYVTVAIGCTGGQHRSVYLVEKLAESFKGVFDQVLVKHRELS